MANPVLLADLEARWRPLTDQEKVVAQSNIDDAWELLQAQMPGVEARLEAGTLSPGLVRKIECEAVLRVLKNPDAIKQWSIDDASFTRDSTVSSGLLFYLPEELAQVAPVVGYGYGAGGAYMISLGG